MSSETASEAAPDEDDALLPSQATNATEIDTIVTRSSSKPRSFVWKHMKKIGNKAICTPCKKELTINQFTTSNLISHLKKHGITQASSDSDSVIKLGNRQLTIQEAVDRGFNQETFDALLPVFLIKSDAPFLTVEHPEFISLLQCLNPRVKIPVRTTFQRRIMTLYENELELQRKEWSNVTSKFSFGMDIWSSPNGIPFMGI